MVFYHYGRIAAFQFSQGPGRYDKAFTHKDCTAGNRREVWIDQPGGCVDGGVGHGQPPHIVERAIYDTANRKKSKSNPAWSGAIP